MNFTLVLLICTVKEQARTCENVESNIRLSAAYCFLPLLPLSSSSFSSFSPPLPLPLPLHLPLPLNKSCQMTYLKATSQLLQANLFPLFEGNIEAWSAAKRA